MLNVYNMYIILFTHCTAHIRIFCISITKFLVLNKKSRFYITENKKRRF